MLGGSVTSNKALVAQIVAIVTAIIGVCVAAGIDINRDLQEQIITLITVLAPAAIAGIAWVNHNHAKVAAARELAATPQTQAAAQQQAKAKR